MKQLINVSVPYRGILFFNNDYSGIFSNMHIVSVPYRGILFFNQSKKGIYIITYRFPSPIGESYFSIKPPFYYRLYSLCFRPLSGNLIFQQKRNRRQLRGSVSVPYRGILFFNPSPTPACSSGLPRHFAWERDFSWNS